MKKWTLPLVALTALALLGAGCGLQPLSSNDQPRGYADEKVTDKTAESKPADTMTKPDDAMTDDKPADDGAMKEEPKMEEPKPGESTSTGNGYGGTVIGDVKLKADENSIVFFLTAEKADYKGSDAYMEFGCESLLIPVRKELSKDQSDLATALVQLITTKEQAYADQGLRNAIAPSAPTIKLTNIHYDGKTRVIDFEGSFKSAGVCEDPRIKAQIEETVKLYATDYRIQLNGDAKNWRCLGDQSGQCV